jgi:hypothetical protein
VAELKRNLTIEEMINGTPVADPTCAVCGGSGTESSGVCYCGSNIEGHSLYDNHSAVEMTRPCECVKCIKQEAPRG